MFPNKPLSVIHHISLPATNLERSSAFYDAVLATLGHQRIVNEPTVIGYGFIDNGDIFSLRLRSKEQIMTGDGFHIAFMASTRSAVDAFHQAAMAHGGKDNGGYGLHPEYGANYYAAFVFDPDGYRIEAVICGRA